MVVTTAGKNNVCNFLINKAPSSFDGIGVGTTLFNDNYDGETEGTSPPANWTNESMTTMEVDDAQFRSSPHSMKINKSGAIGYAHHDITAGINNEMISHWVYFGNILCDRRFITQSTTGGRSVINSMAYIIFRDGTIYSQGSTETSTGYNYTAGIWYNIKIQHDVTNSTYDAWLDDVKIVDGSVYYDTHTGFTSVKSMQIEATTVSSTGTMWVDDIDVGKSNVGSTHLSNLDYGETTTKTEPSSTRALFDMDFGTGDGTSGAVYTQVGLTSSSDGTGTLLCIQDIADTPNAAGVAYRFQFDINVVNV